MKRRLLSIPVGLSAFLVAALSKKGDLDSTPPMLKLLGLGKHEHSQQSAAKPGPGTPKGGDSV